ncbi:NAD(P)/FAD-dependent oxidoreductase [Nonomuraea dietziae]|uniref:NAD(P)/FAD-dependent oxidoreductase n=1 Tax=Nonomuraea dietziae TaxID=65515 RepID=UPI003421797A
MNGVLVIGASVGGLTVVEALRRKGYGGRIGLVGDEPHLPYDRPPLSKEILTGRWPIERVLLRNREQLDDLDAELYLGRRAEQLNLQARTVCLDDGRSLRYDTLVIATGLAPRPLPFQPDIAGIHTLRTVDDALALRRELSTVRRVVIIGAGVLGCEIAAAARSLGRQVTLIDPLPVPMARQIGGELGARIAAMHQRRGVHLRMGAGVCGFNSVNGRVGAVELAGGEVVPTDLVVIAAGSVPATGWLTGSGLTLSDGIECDAYCRAAPDVYAVGDVARWRHPVTGVSTRLENRTNATEQALTVAANILRADRPYTPTPYFWTDQYDTKIQVHGVIAPDSRIRLIEGDAAAGRFVALAESGDTVTAAIGWNHPRGVRTARRRLVMDP